MYAFDPLERRVTARSDVYRTWGDEARDMALAGTTEPCCTGLPPVGDEKVD